MELLLWRHAQAEEGHDDLKRCLTVKGAKQADDMAAWLHAHAPKTLRILASPAQRTVQTADALKRPYRTDDRLAPLAKVEDLLAAVGWPDGEGDDDAVLVVGHQPTLGEAAALILCGEAQPWGVKKGGLWWLSHKRKGGIPKVSLRLVLSPGDLA